MRTQNKSHRGATGLPNRWRPAEPLHGHLERTVSQFLYLAKHASKVARGYRQTYLQKGPGHWSHDQWLQYSRQRHDWIHSARCVLVAMYRDYGFGARSRNQAKQYEAHQEPAVIHEEVAA